MGQVMFFGRPLLPSCNFIGIGKETGLAIVPALCDARQGLVGWAKAYIDSLS